MTIQRGFQYKRIHKFKMIIRDFLGGPVIRNPAANAGDMGLPLALDDRPSLRAPKPMHLELRRHKERSHWNEKPTHHNRK